ncbi:MAG: DUF2726 domain-containing protein [Ectothiorhodospiraceae bacterium]|nr:DUF2726 domain-containing protein [Ectothiorhodospiraceae bacterium]
METLFIPVTALIILALLVVLRLRTRHKLRSQPPRVKLQPPLSQNEQACYRILTRSLPGHLVIPGIGYPRFLAPLNPGHRHASSLIREMQAYTADFLICDIRFQVIAVVSVREQRDARAEAMLREAAIPLLRFEAANLPDEAEVRETFRDLESLGGMARQLDHGNTSAPPAPQPVPIKGGHKRPEVVRERKEPKF